MKEEYVNSVVELKRVPDRIRSLKLEMLNVVNVYVPQIGCQERKRNSGISLMKGLRVSPGG